MVRGYGTRPGTFRRQSTATELLHPMYVMRIKTFLDIDLRQHFGGVVPCHQQLLDEGLLVEWSPTGIMGPVSFVSHQWMSFSHADPHFEQLHVLRRVMQRIREGDIQSIRAGFYMRTGFPDAEEEHVTREALEEWIEEGYFWFDYFSVPQSQSYDTEANDSLMNAVNSIPGYIELCKLFIVLCPPLEHKDNCDGDHPAVNDFASWSRRGWCRAELLAQALSRKQGPLIKIDSAEGRPVLIGPISSFSSAGRGDFTCCERGHKFTRKNAESGVMETVQVGCDRVKVGVFMKNLIDKHVHTILERLNFRASARSDKEQRRLLFELRWMQSRTAASLAGLPSAESERVAGQRPASPPLSFSNFMAANMFDEARVDGDALDAKSGWTPLRFAVIAREHAVVEELLRRGADREAPLEETDVLRAHGRGMTILQSAAMFSTAGIVQTLLQSGADPHNTQASGLAVNSLCGIAAIRDDVLVVQTLLQHDPSLAEQRDATGCIPLHSAAMSNNGKDGGAVMRVLLAHQSPLQLHSLSNAGADLLMSASSADRGDPGVLATLLKNPQCALDVNRQTAWSDCTWRWWCMGLAGRLCRGVSRSLGLRSSALTLFWSSLSPGQTALMKAARVGSVPFARVLLAAGACPLLRDSLGRTARDIAAEFGPFPLLERVLYEAEQSASTASHSQLCAVRVDEDRKCPEQSVVISIPGFEPENFSRASSAPRGPDDEMCIGRVPS